MATQVAFVAGAFDEVSAVVVQAGINAQYKFSDNIEGGIGMTNFTTDVVIEDNIEKQDISYAYGGLFMGVHFVF